MHLFYFCGTLIVKDGAIFMAKTSHINIRIEPSVKAQAEAVYAALGISLTDAINVFLYTSILEGGFPFQPKTVKKKKNKGIGK